MAWDDIDLVQKIALFQMRTKIGKQRQPEWTDHLDSLENVINQKVYNSKRKLIQTPYENYCEELFENFCKCEKDFETGGNWLDAELEDSRSFYRIETLSSFLRKHKDIFSTYSDTAEAYNINPNFQSFEVIFESLFTSYLSKKNWMPLTSFVTAFHSPRNISWWSNDFLFETHSMLPSEMAGIGLSYKHKWIIDFAFKVGLSSDWLADNLLFLKLDTSKIDKDKFKIPSVIDAYTQPIFSPQLNLNPQSGRAFDLATDVKPKTREYIVKDVPVEAISFIPVRINERELDSINAQPRITKKLIDSLITNI